MLYEPPDAFMDFQVDLLLAKSDYHRTAIQRRISIQFPDLDIDLSVLACEDLILHKLLAERLIDLADAAALLVANQQSLDYVYLRAWAEKLHLRQLLEQSWHSVLPDESMPG